MNPLSLGLARSIAVQRLQDRGSRHAASAGDLTNAGKITSSQQASRTSHPPQAAQPQLRVMRLHPKCSNINKGFASPFKTLRI